MDDNEEYYDSLDEDSYNDYSSSQEIAAPEKSLNSKPWSKQSSRIPVYTGAISREALSLKFEDISKLSKSCSMPCSLVSKIKPCTRKSINTLTPKENKQKTYTGLFNARQKMKKGTTSAPANTNRGTCGTNRTISSTYTSCTNVNCTDWEATSIFKNFGPEKTDQNSGYWYTNDSMSSNMSNKSNGSEVNLDNLHSISEMDMLKANKTKHKYAANSLVALNAPVLGSLGPDLLASKDKQDQLRKKQEYGIKASIKNRIRIIQSYKSKYNV